METHVLQRQGGALKWQAHSKCCVNGVQCELPNALLELLFELLLQLLGLSFASSCLVSSTLTNLILKDLVT